MATITKFPSRQEMWDCVTLCIETQKHCLDTVRYCLDKGGKFAAAQRIRSLLDCASICQTAADDSRHGSILYIQSCAYCADLCERCAHDFRNLTDDETIRACVEVCMCCAAACRQMSLAAAA
jgi:hypothetical protein